MTRDAPEPDPLPELLDSLEETLTALREELEPGGTREFRERSIVDRRRRPPRPPRMREILRFTDEYTIPTLITVLEANVRLLRLAQAGIRAVDPERSVFGDSRSDSAFGDELRRTAGGAGRASADRLASSLSELQRALTEADSPENPEARELLTDARSLSSEIEQRIRESRDQTDLSWFGTERDRTWSRTESTDAEADDAPVRIEVQDEATTAENEATTDADESSADDEPDVDVDAELASIKQEMGHDEDGDEDDGSTSEPAGESDEPDEGEENESGESAESRDESRDGS